MEGAANPDFELLLRKAEHFCAYRERCNSEVIEKLKKLGAPNHQVSKILSNLSDNGFLNQERFCRAFINGKITNNKWGRTRISMELRIRQIPEKLIENALKQFDQQEYEKILEQVAQKKAATINDSDHFTRNGKIAAYCISKGFEPDLVWQVLKNKF